MLIGYIAIAHGVFPPCLGTDGPDAAGVDGTDGSLSPVVDSGCTDRERMFGGGGRSVGTGDLGTAMPSPAVATS